MSESNLKYSNRLDNGKYEIFHASQLKSKYDLSSHRRGSENFWWKIEGPEVP